MPRSSAGVPGQTSAAPPRLRLDILDDDRRTIPYRVREHTRLWQARSAGSRPNCLGKGLPVRTWRLRGLHAKNRSPCQDKSDRVAHGPNRPSADSQSHPPRGKHRGPAAFRCGTALTGPACLHWRVAIGRGRPDCNRPLQSGRAPLQLPEPGLTHSSSPPIPLAPSRLQPWPFPRPRRGRCQDTKFSFSPPRRRANRPPARRLRRRRRRRPPRPTRPGCGCTSH